MSNDASTTDLRKGRRSRNSGNFVNSVDRLPPHSIEAEQGVLGCILLKPNECMNDCIAVLRTAAFYDLRHQELYECLVAMFDRKEAIDIITVQQRLKDAQKLDQVGGVAYLASLPDFVPSAANLPRYLQIVREKFILRKALTVGSDICARIFEHAACAGPHEVDELLDGIETDVLAISQERVEGSKATELKPHVLSALSRLEEWHAGQGALSGLSTGFADLDRMTTGLHGGEMIVIAGRPSMGKTSLAMNIAENVALDQRLPVAVFSLEMTTEALTLRMLCSRARVNLRSLREGFFTDRDFPKLSSAAGKLAACPLHVDDTPGLSIIQLRARARRLWQQHGIKLFVIDYLQLLHSTNRRAENRQQEITDISGGLKALAKELDVPVIVLAQLNRSTEKEARKPRMSDLRESGAIEQDADLIGLLYRAEEEDENSARAEALAVNLLIDKQRNGPTGDVNLTFLKSYTRFESAAKISGEDGQ